jgi:hypothetical protein
VANNESFAEYIVPVLVEDPTVYWQERGLDHGLRLYPFLRPKPTTITYQPLALTRPPPPAWVLLEDKFASVYPVLELFEQAAVPIRPQPFFALTLAPNRVDDLPQEEQFHRVDHNLIRAFRSGTINTLAAAYLYYDFEVMDLCNDPWLEWMHPGPTPESAFAPFFQHLTPVIPSTRLSLELMYQAPNWRIEAEEDFRYAREPDYSAEFRQIYVTPLPTVAVRVQAKAAGFYMNDYKDIGDVFDIQLQDLSDAGVEIVNIGDPDYPLFGWMTVVPSTTPLFSLAATGAGIGSIRAAPRRTIE